MVLNRASDGVALELAAAYQQRWEYEISLKEIETQLLESGTGLRSKPPELVKQEFWGRTLNIVRRQTATRRDFSETLSRARTAAITEILERVTNGAVLRSHDLPMSCQAGCVTVSV